MATKILTKPFIDALAEGRILDLIRHAATDDELEIMKTRLKMAKNQGMDIHNLMLGDVPVALYLIRKGRLQSIKILAGLGLNLHATNTRNSNALHYCAQRETQYLSFFIQQGVSVHHRNKQGSQPLAVVCYNFAAVDVHTRISNLKAFLDAGANINDAIPVEGYNRGKTVLHWAISTHSDALKTLDFLMQQPELEIHNVGGGGDSALHIAAAQGSLEVTKYLIDTGRFDLDQVNDYGATALDLARCNGKEGVLDYLTHIYAIWAEKKELDAITSRTTNNMANAKDEANKKSLAAGMGSGTRVAEGGPSGRHDSIDTLGAASLAESPNSRPYSKPKSL